MELLKKIIREELTKALSTLGETDFYNSVDYKIKSNGEENPKENIIYDYEKGNVFAGDNLEPDIINLNRYHLVEYLPKNQNEERWTFECETVYGTTLMVDIKRIIRDGKSLWKLSFGQLYKGEQMPTLIANTTLIEGYENFISTVNKTISHKIDPSKF